MPQGSWQALAAALPAARDAPWWRYPWDGLEEQLDQDLRLIGYGSLVHAGSARRTVSSEHRVPVIVAGAKRLFNYEMDPVPDRYGPLRVPEDRAALNVRVTYRPDDLLNGVHTRVAREEIAALRTREAGYDLLPVPWVPWTAPERPPAVAYILTAPEEVIAGRRRTSAAINPHRQYYALCRAGAASFGAEFLAFWLESTFLADGTTPVREWERLAGPVAE